jgi:hypothetical protein
MQSRGVVFLPAAGYRVYDDINDGYARTYINFGIGDGAYWTTSASENRAMYLSLNENRVELYDGMRFWGCSVRLVRNVR